MNSKCLILPTIVALGGFLPQTKAGLMLGSADSFAVLGGSTVTSTGNTVLNGNLGVYPGPAITGFPPGIVNGTTYAGGSVAKQAQIDALAAYTVLIGETPTQDLTDQNLGLLILTPGVYHFASGAQLTGILQLDGQNNPNARFDFQIGSTLVTASSASVLLINGAQAGNVYWQVGSSATLGTETLFFGSILADQSITLNTRANIDGRAFALNGAVTLDGNVITAVPEPGAFGPLVICALVFGAGQCWAVGRRKARSFLRVGRPMADESQNTAARRGGQLIGRRPRRVLSLAHLLLEGLRAYKLRVACCSRMN